MRAALEKILIKENRLCSFMDIKLPGQGMCGNVFDDVRQFLGLIWVKLNGKPSFEGKNKANSQKTKE
jgi:hypothetical protein